MTCAGPHTTGNGSSNISNQQFATSFLISSQQETFDVVAKADEHGNLRKKMKAFIHAHGGCCSSPRNSM